MTDTSVALFTPYLEVIPFTFCDLPTCNHVFVVCINASEVCVVCVGRFHSAFFKYRILTEHPCDEVKKYLEL